MFKISEKTLNKLPRKVKEAYELQKQLQKENPTFCRLLEAREACTRTQNATINAIQPIKNPSARQRERLQTAKQKLAIFKKNESEGRSFFRNSDNSVNPLFWWEFNYFDLKKCI